jgi:RNA polymerase sigma-70 factor (ECF subfamily)
VNDEQLLARVAQGEHAALAVLYDRYAGAVFAMALRIVADREIAQEVTQEIFLRVWRHAATYDSRRGRATTWILGLTHHLAIDQVRRRRTQARPMPAGDDGETITLDVPDPAVDVEAEVWGAERQRVLAAALRDLPPPQREVIEHAYFRGLTQAEIARLVGIPLGTVKTRLRLGVRRLRTILQSQGLTPASV